MRSLGFGLERLGLVAIRAPVATLLVIAALSAFTSQGLSRLQADDALSELFRSNTPEFQNYAVMSDRFPASEFDVLIVVEGADLLTPEKFETVRLLQYDLELADGIAGVLSVFSMRDPPDEKGFPPPMIPDEMPQGEAFTALMERVASHPLLQGRFLSLPKGDEPALTVLVVSLNKQALSYHGLDPALNAVQATIDEVLAGSGLKTTLSGAPVMQREIRDAIRRDRIVYNGAGLIIGTLLCLAFFRRPSLVLIAASCPILAVLWAMGLLGWSGQKLNTFINVIPPLVMVIAFSDAMHMVFSVRRQIRQGADRFSAARHAVLTVGPACVLTSLTTTVALLALAITDSAMIRQFGVAAALATLMAFVATILIVPMATVLVFRDEEKFRAGETSRIGGIKWLEDMCRALGHWINRNAVAIAVAGAVLFATFATMHAQLRPHYRLSDEVPGRNQSVGASERLDERLTGAHPLHIMVGWPESEKISSPRVLAALSDTHKLHESHRAVGNVWSVETLRRWLENIGVEGGEKLAEYVALLPEHLTARFVNADARAALVTGRLPNLNADDAVPIMRELDERLKVLRERYPQMSFTVTGLAAVSALQSADMIWQLNTGLFTAIFIVIVLIGVAFASPRVALMGLIPNTFPIVAGGAFLYLTADGLAYASVIALTVGFGLAVDDTIHFLARLHREEAKQPDLGVAIQQTIERIGPVLILTTLVLLAGLAVTMASDLPAMQLFGQLTMLTLSGAVIADLIVLPAFVLTLHRVMARRKLSTG